MKDIREFINIVENSQLYFHGSREKLAIGTILNPMSEYDNDVEVLLVEKVLENFRPTDCIPRNKSVYMVSDPDPDLIDRAGGYSNFIYQVKPQGKIEKNDVHWWAKILDNIYDENHLSRNFISEYLKKMAINYWAGNASNRPTWEYRCESAIIVSLQNKD